MSSVEDNKEQGQMDVNASDESVNVEDKKEQGQTDVNAPVESVNIEDKKEQGQVDVKASDESVNMPSPQDQEAAAKKKYGGLMPRKPPLISKDHERAYFDSADWALGKQGGQKPKGPLEALRPKLQPTQQQTRYRKSHYAPSDEEGGSVPSGEEAPSNE